MKTTSRKTRTSAAKVTRRNEPHIVSDKKFTATSAQADIESILANARRMLPRRDYLTLCTNVADGAQMRVDAVHEEIATEYHEDRDV